MIPKLHSQLFVIEKLGARKPKTFFWDADYNVTCNKINTSNLKPNNLHWKTFHSFWPNWDQNAPDFQSIRSWRSPLIVGNPDISQLIANDLLPATKTGNGLIMTLSKKLKSFFNR